MLTGSAPSGVDFPLRPQPPHRQAGMRDAYHFAHPLHLSVEVGVVKKAANERSGLILPDVQNNQAISAMAEFRHVEIRIAGEECDMPLLAQENGDLVVLAFPCGRYRLRFASGLPGKLPARVAGPRECFRPE